MQTFLMARHGHDAALGLRARSRPRDDARPTSRSFVSTIRGQIGHGSRSLDEGFGAPVPDARVGFLGFETLGTPVPDARIIERALAPVAHARVVEGLFAPVPDAGVALLEEMRYPDERADRDGGDARGLNARRGDARLDGNFAHGGVGGDGEGHGAHGGEVRRTRRFARSGMVREKAKKRLLPRHPIRRGFRSEISTGIRKSDLLSWIFFGFNQFRARL